MQDKGIFDAVQTLAESFAACSGLAKIGPRRASRSSLQVRGPNLKGKKLHALKRNEAVK